MSMLQYEEEINIGGNCRLTSLKSDWLLMMRPWRGGDSKVIDG